MKDDTTPVKDDSASPTDWESVIREHIIELIMSYGKVEAGGMILPVASVTVGKDSILIHT